eukprot:scaffold3207_cov112-Isochrysis_galbana.AAC.4
MVSSMMPPRAEGLNQYKDHLVLLVVNRIIYIDDLPFKATQNTLGELTVGEALELAPDNIDPSPPTRCGEGRVDMVRDVELGRLTGFIFVPEHHLAGSHCPQHITPAVEDLVVPRVVLPGQAIAKTIDVRT